MLKSTPTTIARLLTLGVVSVVATAAFAGCSSDSSDPSGSPASSDSSDSSAEPSDSDESASVAPYLPVPDGVDLTPPGTSIEVGDHAVVAYNPRQNTVGVLDIEVTALEKTTVKETFGAWQLSDAQKASTPYFVRTKIENVGESNLGGRPVPLYALSDGNVLFEPTPFASSFAPCPSTPFPEKFGPGAKTDACLVYLIPDEGKLDAVSFRPEETFDPIIWTGKVEKYTPPKAKKKDKKN